MSQTTNLGDGAGGAHLRYPRPEYVRSIAASRTASRLGAPQVDSPAEKAVDAVIHVLGLLGAGVALDRLFARLAPYATTDRHLALLVYSLGLIGMLTMSALYNLSPTGPWKGVLRRCDRAMIFVMIAGSYTPFVLTAFAPSIGRMLCIVVWILAAVCIGLCLTWQRLFDRLSIALYLCMGWLILVIFPPLMATVSATVLVLLLAGGIVYSLGVIAHTRVRMAFHNAVWHGMVVTAAALHLTAIALVLS
jgi:hemolysin III